MPKSILLSTAVTAAVLLLGAACSADSADAGKAAEKTGGKETSRSADAKSNGPANGSKQNTPEDSEADQRDAAKDKASREKTDRDKAGDSGGSDGSDGSDDSDGSAAKPAPEEDSGDGTADDPEPGTLRVTGGEFSTLTFPTVQCSSDGSDLYLQTQSNDPATVLTVLFNGGSAAHASLQTAPKSGDGTTWSDDDAETVSTSVQREDDTVTLSNAVLKPLGDDSELTVSGSLTCNEEL